MKKELFAPKKEDFNSKKEDFASKKENKSSFFVKKELLILFSYHEPFSHLFIRNKPAIICKNIKLGYTGIIVFFAFEEFS